MPASLEVEYTRSIESDANVTIALRVPELGTSSLPIDYEVRADGERTASGRQPVTRRRCSSTERRGDSRPLPDEWRERIDAQRADNSVN